MSKGPTVYNKKFHKIFINGKWIDSSSDEGFVSINPATGQKIGLFPYCKNEEIIHAIESAEKAFDKWSSVPAPKRGLILLKIAEMLKKDKQRLGRLVTMEMGKVISEGLSDIQEAIDVFEYMAGEGRRLFGHTTTSELKDKFSMTIRRPVGVCGLITPFNFPVAIPAWKLSPALICGNTVVLKPASDAASCAVELVKVMEKAGIPKGVVNLVTGRGEEAGATLVRHPSVRGISLTGSRETGKYVMQNAGIKKIGLELGSKNAIIIMNDADLKLALEGVLWGAFATSGQRCTAASRVVVHKDVRKKFEKMLAASAKKLRVGNGLDKNTDVGPLINQFGLNKVKDYVEIGKEEGAKLLLGGKELKRKGFFHSCTVFGNVSSDMRIAREEIFGPVVSLIEAKNFNDAIEITNSVDYGLSAAIYTKNISHAFKAIDKIESGLTYVNASTIGSEVHLPFGGVKQSGNAKEAGIHGIDEFSEIKTVYIDYSGKLQKAQIDPYD